MCKTKITMKTIVITFGFVAILGIASLAQQRDQKQGDSISNAPRHRQSNTLKNDAAQDTIQPDSKHRAPGVGVAESNESENSKSDDEKTVTQKEKTNKPGKRSQNDEDETGKKRERREKDNP